MFSKVIFEEGSLEKWHEPTRIKKTGSQLVNTTHIKRNYIFFAVKPTFVFERIAEVLFEL